jgi:hypothetical protein
VRSWTVRASTGLASAGLLAAVLAVGAPVLPAAAAAAQHSRAEHAPLLVTRITTTTVVSTPSARKAQLKCPPGSINPSLCERLPSRPSRKPQAHKRPPAPVTKPAAAAPTAGKPVTSPAGVQPAGTLPSAPPVSPLQSTALNLLLGVFPVPPFLLPIYHAAATDYDVPWQVLAAINEIETDYGRNLSTSPAGAVGWMQFLPSTWAKFGVDADGNDAANPYDPVDAISSAARYLQAAGADRSLPSAIFAYNHATWYVNSVELRASLLRFLPQRLVDVLTGLMQARFPIGGHLGRDARQVPAAVQVGGQPGVVLNAPPGAPVIAAADGRVVAIGRGGARGRYITIEDSDGDRFTYAQLGKIESIYPVLKPRRQSALGINRALDAGPGGDARIPVATKLLASGSSSGPAGGTAQGVNQGGTRATAKARPTDKGRAEPALFVPLVKERLFAHPSRPASYAAGGRIQLQSERAANGARAGARQADYYSTTVRLAAGGFALAHLARGSVVLAGTILGRVGRSAPGSGQIVFQIRPAGAREPVDPGPIVAGWQLLGRLTAGRASIAGATQAGAYGSANPWVGQLLMAPTGDLRRAVLGDPEVMLDACGRRAIGTGGVDRRVLAAIEYLSYVGLRPGVTGLACPTHSGTRVVLDTQFSLTQIAGTPVAGHQQDGGVVDLAIRQLLALQGALRPARIVSLLRYPWEPATVARTSGASEIEVDFEPVESTALGSLPDALDTAQWKRLIRRLVRMNGP